MCIYALYSRIEWIKEISICISQGWNSVDVIVRECGELPQLWWFYAFTIQVEKSTHTKKTKFKHTRNWNIRWPGKLRGICYLAAFSFASIMLHWHMYIGMCVLLYYSRLKFFCEIYQISALQQILFITCYCYVSFHEAYKTGSPWSLYLVSV